MKGKKMDVSNFVKIYFQHVKTQDVGKKDKIRCNYCGEVIYQNGEFYDCCSEMKERIEKQKVEYYNEKKKEEEFNKVEKGMLFTTNMSESGLEGFEKTVNFKKYVTGEDLVKIKNKSICKQFCKDDKVFLMLSGTVGTGKTHLAVSTMKYIAFHNDLDFSILRCSQTFVSDEVAKHISVGVCVIDDLGRETGSEARITSRRAFISDVIEARARNNRKTIITTNLDEEEIIKNFGAHIFDRITENCAVCERMEGESFRGQK